MRHTGSYGPLHETHRQVDEQQNSPAAHRPNYDQLRETQHDIDNRRNAEAEPAPPERPDIQRRWTERGGMVPQQGSANIWIRQNYEIRMAENDKPGAGREEFAPGSTREEGAQSSQSEQELDEAELQEARAAIEETRNREAAERSRQQERERSGPER